MSDIDIGTGGQGMMLMRPTKEFIVISGLALAFNARNSTVFFSFGNLDPGAPTRSQRRNLSCALLQGRSMCFFWGEIELKSSAACGLEYVSYHISSFLKPK